MRYTSLLALVSVALLQSAPAAVTVGATNVDLAGAVQLITDNTGAPATGSWAAGYFAPGTDFLGDAASVRGAFDQNGSAAAFSSQAGAFGAFGALPVSDAGTSLDGSDQYTGTPVYIVVANATSFDAATDYVVFRSAIDWPQEVAGVGGAVSLNTALETVVRGIDTTVTGAVGPLAAQNGMPGVTFGAVPEPSATLLAGLAGLALVIRRKR